MIPRSTLFRRVSTAAVLVLFAACGDDPVSPVDRSGMYYAQTADGQTLPAAVDYELSGGDATVTEISSGRLVLFPDRTYILEFELRVLPAGETETFPGRMTITAGNGMYSISENRVVIDNDEDPPLIGTFSDARTVSLDLSAPLGTVEFAKNLP